MLTGFKEIIKDHKFWGFHRIQVPICQLQRVNFVSGSVLEII